MIRLIDVVGYAAPMVVLLLTREMSLRALGMLSRVGGCYRQYRDVPSAGLVAALDTSSHEHTTAVGYADRHLRRKRQAASQVASPERRLK